MLKELIMKNRSYRSFRPDTVIPRSLLIDLIDAVRYTPSSVNLQPLKFMVCTEKDRCAIVEENVKYAKALKDAELPPRGHEPSAYILIFLDTDISDNLLTFRRDVGICAQTLMLLATEQGYGGCMIGNFNGSVIAEKMNIASRYSLQLILALGIPDEEIILEDAQNGSINYYRDNNFIHHVPKRRLDDIIL